MPRGEFETGDYIIHLDNEDPFSDEIYCYGEVGKRIVYCRECIHRILERDPIGIDRYWCESNDREGDLLPPEGFCAWGENG